MNNIQNTPTQGPLRSPPSTSKRDNFIDLVILGSILLVVASLVILSIGQYRPRLLDNFAYIYYGLGTKHQNQGKYEQAITDFNRSLLISPIYNPVYISRGIDYLKLEDYEHALADFSQEIGGRGKMPVNWL